MKGKTIFQINEECLKLSDRSIIKLLHETKYYSKRDILNFIQDKSNIIMCSTHLTKDEKVKMYALLNVLKDELQ